MQKGPGVVISCKAAYDSLLQRGVLFYSVEFLIEKASFELQKKASFEFRTAGFELKKRVSS